MPDSTVARLVGPSKNSHRFRAIAVRIGWITARQVLEQQLLQFSDAVDRLSGFERGIPFDIQGYRA